MHRISIWPVMFEANPTVLYGECILTCRFIIIDVAFLFTSGGTQHHEYNIEQGLSLLLTGGHNSIQATQWLS